MCVCWGLGEGANQGIDNPLGRVTHRLCLTGHGGHGQIQGRPVDFSLSGTRL